MGLQDLLLSKRREEIFKKKKKKKKIKQEKQLLPHLVNHTASGGQQQPPQPPPSNGGGGQVAPSMASGVQNVEMQPSNRIEPGPSDLEQPRPPRKSNIVTVSPASQLLQFQFYKFHFQRESNLDL